VGSGRNIAIMTPKMITKDPNIISISKVAGLSFIAKKCVVVCG